MLAPVIHPTPFNQDAVQRELMDIASWWSSVAVDEINGGFFGEIDSCSTPQILAHKGVILNTRILWFFSELALFSGDEKHIQLANRAYQWILTNLVDPIHGGLVWEVESLLYFNPAT